MWRAPGTEPLPGEAGEPIASRRGGDGKLKRLGVQAPVVHDQALCNRRGRAIRNVERQHRRQHVQPARRLRGGQGPRSGECKRQNSGGSRGRVGGDRPRDGSTRVLEDAGAAGDRTGYGGWRGGTVSKLERDRRGDRHSVRQA